MWEKIEKIEELDVQEAIDVEVDGNHLFYANYILTHNSNSDVGLEDTSESFGLPATADFMIALIVTDELTGLNQIMVKQLKNRWGDPNSNKRFVLGIDRSRMKLYNVEQSAQDDIMNDTPVMSNSPFGQRWEEAEKDAASKKSDMWKGFS
jgi:hypothetical protein